MKLVRDFARGGFVVGNEIPMSAGRNKRAPETKSEGIKYRERLHLV